jgi:hypothetical protein
MIGYRIQARPGSLSAHVTLETPDGAKRYTLRFAPERPNNCGREMNFSTFLPGAHRH